MPSTTSPRRAAKAPAQTISTEHDVETPSVSNTKTKILKKFDGGDASAQTATKILRDPNGSPARKPALSPAPTPASEPEEDDEKGPDLDADDNND